MSKHLLIFLPFKDYRMVKARRLKQQAQVDLNNQSKIFVSSLQSILIRSLLARYKVNNMRYSMQYAIY